MMMIGGSTNRRERCFEGVAATGFSVAVRFDIAYSEFPHSSSQKRYGPCRHIILVEHSWFRDVCRFGNHQRL
jgi:hypothetical protein